MLIYAFHQNSLKVIHNYLFGRSQKTKLGSSFVRYIVRCTQGFVLGPLLFNICDLFLSEYSFEFTNFADDTTPYECGKNYDKVINKLEDTIEKLFNWFQCKNFKANESTCHFFSHHINQLR